MLSCGKLISTSPSLSADGGNEIQQRREAKVQKTNEDDCCNQHQENDTRALDQVVLGHPYDLLQLALVVLDEVCDLLTDLGIRAGQNEQHGKQDHQNRTGDDQLPGQGSETGTGGTMVMTGVRIGSSSGSGSGSGSGSSTGSGSGSLSGMIVIMLLGSLAGSLGRGLGGCLGGCFGRSFVSENCKNRTSEFNCKDSKYVR